MKFFDFLQDVVFAGVIVAAAVYVMDQRTGATSSLAPLPSSSVQTQQPTTPSATPSGLVATTRPAPLPLDLNSLEQSLDDLLGLNRPTTEPTFRPEAFEPVDLPTTLDSRASVGRPAPRSVPLGNILRESDQTDLFDDALTFGNDEVRTRHVLPEPTRKLGPVEMLTVPLP